MIISTEASEYIDRAPAEVFAFVTDAANEPKWHTDVIEAEVLTDAPVSVGSRYRWLMSFMGRKEQVMEVTRLKADRLLVMKGGEIMGLTPTITYAIEPDGSGTRFTRRIEMDTRGVGNLFAPMLRSRRGAEHNHGFVRNAKAVLESS